MKKRLFTLIELLVVIVIISILMGILLPVLGTVRTKGRIARAQAEMKGMITAVKSYEADYGYLPVGSSSFGGVKTGSAADTVYRTFIEILSGADGPDADTTPNGTTSYGNPRNVKYLDVPGSYSSTANGNVCTGDFVDPWGTLYKVYLDSDYDGQVTTPAGVLNGSVFLYSFGPNATDDSCSASKDDVCSWR